MDIYRLGKVSWWESQCYYHALAYLGREGIIICRPAEPYVCLGLHDDLEQEIDQDFCRSRGLPLLRRETGGGVVYLDNRQIFYQVVLHRNNPRLPMRRDRFFATVLQPAIDIYRSFGFEAELAPPADIKVDGRKCSGNAAGDIGTAATYVGNLLIDFNFDLMSRVLKVASPAHRMCLRRAMQENMITLSQRMCDVDMASLEADLALRFERQFGALTEKPLDREMKDTALRLKHRLTSRKWLEMPGRRGALRRIKIAEGLYLQETGSGRAVPALVLIRDGEVVEMTIPQKAPQDLHHGEGHHFYSQEQKDREEGVTGI